MPAFYNEIDPYAAQWLRNLIAAGHIAPGVVDERDIRDIHPDDLAVFTQCHFFAGIGVWSHALRLAGWPDERPVWTGSCPCQPFSAAGKGVGFSDERHLWPAWHHLIQECGPRVVFGEQVASKDGLAWLDLVHADMEGARYALGAVDTCAAGFGAPHIRQRLYFVAHAGQEQRRRWTDERKSGCEDAAERDEAAIHDQRCGGAGLVAHADTAGQREQRSGGLLDGERPTQRDNADGRGSLCKLGNAERDGLRIGRRSAANESDEPSFWSLCDWIPCRDGKTRPVEPGTFPLAHGIANRVGRLRATGNAIAAPAAAGFIAAAVEAMA